jgi:hypothetical protein
MKRYELDVKVSLEATIPTTSLAELIQDQERLLEILRKKKAVIWVNSCCLPAIFHLTGVLRG